MTNKNADLPLLAATAVIIGAVVVGSHVREQPTPTPAPEPWPSVLVEPVKPQRREVPQVDEAATVEAGAGAEVFKVDPHRAIEKATHADLWHRSYETGMTDAGTHSKPLLIAITPDQPSKHVHPTAVHCWLTEDSPYYAELRAAFPGADYILIPDVGDGTEPDAITYTPE